MTKARIWESAPDPLDGFFVEAIMTHQNLNLQIDCTWRQTIEQCKEWAKNQGITIIEMV